MRPPPELAGRTNADTPAIGCPLSFTTFPLIVPLVGSSALFDASATEAAAEIDPITDIHGSADYRRHLVLGLVKAALAKAVERASLKH